MRCADDWPGAARRAHQIVHRLSFMEGELAQIRKYDYLVVNDDLERACNQIDAIRQAERCRIGRSYD